MRASNSSSEILLLFKELFNKYQQLEKLNRVIVDEFVDKIYIGKINDETNTRDIEIKWNFE